MQLWHSLGSLPTDRRLSPPHTLPTLATPPRKRRSLSSLKFPAAAPFFSPVQFLSAPVSPPQKSLSTPNLSLLTAARGRDYGARHDDEDMDADSEDEHDAPVTFQAPVRHRHSRSSLAAQSRLPTARIRPPSSANAPPRALDLIYACSQALAVIPALLGTLWLVANALVRPPDAPAHPTRADFAVAALWAVLTGHQCVCLATGLTTRWRAYYSPLPTLIRLLGLQSICWPATHATLVIVGGSTRPLVCWALIGSTTCVSRAIQIWVVSNLEPGQSQRHWDWVEIGVKCALPAGVLYLITAWTSMLQREFLGC